MGQFGEVTEEDYRKFRGQCKPLCEQAIAQDPSLTLVRGWYHCPFWGKQEHWWLKDCNGEVVDPSKEQFPSKGFGEYEEYTGIAECEQCGKKVEEKDFVMCGRFVCCSVSCACRLVGL